MSNKNLLKRVKDLIADVDSCVEGKHNMIVNLIVALLTRKNFFILGEKGQAKSLVINLVTERILGAVRFKYQMTKGTDEERLYGRIDISSLMPPTPEKETLLLEQYIAERYPAYQNIKKEYHDILIDIKEKIEAGQEPADADMERKQQLETIAGNFIDAVKELNKAELIEYCRPKPQLVTSGKIPEAHIVILEETFKGNDGSLNSNLTAMNEREFTNEGMTVKIPAISFIGASNEIPDFNNPDDKILEALYDRFEIRMVSEGIDCKDSAMQALKKKIAGNNGVNTTITLDELLEAQEEVRNVIVPDEIHETFWEIKQLLSSKVKISDRRFLNYYPITQAIAWLDGRDKVILSDLKALKYYLWDRPADIDNIVKTIERMTDNPIKEKADEIMNMVRESYEDAFQANYEKGSVDAAKLLKKFRSELLLASRQFDELYTKAASDSDKRLLDNCISEVEDGSKKIHEKYGFSYVDIEQLKMLMA